MEFFLEILLATFHARLLYVAGFAIVSILALSYELYLYGKENIAEVETNKKRKKHRKKSQTMLKKERRIRLVSILLKFIIGWGLLVSFFFSWAMPPYLDAKHKSIKEVEAIYHRRNIWPSRVTSPRGGEIKIITGDGKSRAMELYPGYSSTDFPEGEFPAKVWYGEESDIILKIVPLEE